MLWVYCIINTIKQCSMKQIFVAILTVAGLSYSLHAYSDGTGSSTDPYILDSNSLCLDSGSEASPCYYWIDADVTLSDEDDFLVGDSSLKNYLTVSEGHTLTIPNQMLIGASADSSGIVLVNGAYVIADEVEVGYRGSGQLDIKNGGKVTPLADSYGDGYVADDGDASSGYVTVDGNSSLWEMADGLYLGYDGKAQMRVTNGATVQNTYSYVGRYEGSDGTAELDGDGSLWFVNGDLSIGDYGQGCISINDGAVMAVSGAIGIAVHGGSGSLLLSGGYFAWFGDHAVNELPLPSMQICENGIWTVASEENLSRAYYDSEDAFKAADLYNDVFSRIDLTGYTVFQGGISSTTGLHVIWKDSDWYYSELFKWTYARFILTRWLWTEHHGWIFYYCYAGDNGVAFWDDALKIWWFTSIVAYPSMYCFADQKWYYFIEGETPDRVFWDYEAGARITESDFLTYLESLR